MDPYPLGEPPRLDVKRERQRSVDQRHPWLFDGALRNPPKNLPAGCVVELVDHRGALLARGSYNDASRIVVRILTFADEPVDAELIRRRVAQAAAGRRMDAETTAWRVIFAEADRLPGLIVDRYGEWLVVQILTTGMEVWREPIVAALGELGARGIHERSDSEDRRRNEGLSPQVGWMAGEPVPERVVVREHGLEFEVDLAGGHKTGCYLDQRENRAAVARYCAGQRVLNAFAYTGGFGLYAARAGAAQVTHLDGSAPALELCRANLERNGYADGQEYQCADVFKALKQYQVEGGEFDLIVLDPPKFAATRRQLEAAQRGYAGLNQAALRLLAPGGILATFSCSGAVDPELFWRLVADAATGARREVQILETLGQPADHPVLASFPEGRYLKGLIARVVE